MKNLKKLLSALLVFISVIALNPTPAHAEWKQNATGWWYTEGSSWATGWRNLDSNWYYFDSNGYMAHDRTVDGYYLNSNGAWATSVPTVTTTTTNYGTGATLNTEQKTVWLAKTSKNKIYHFNSNCGNMKNPTQSTLAEVQAEGYMPCEKCAQ